MDMIQIGALVGAGLLVLSNFVNFKSLSIWLKGRLSGLTRENKKGTIGVGKVAMSGEYDLVEAVDKFSGLRRYLVLHKRSEAVESLDVVFSLLNEE